MTSALDALARFDGTITRLGHRPEPGRLAAGGRRRAQPRRRAATATARCCSIRAPSRAGNVSRVGLCRGDRATATTCASSGSGFALEPQAPYEMRTAPGGMGCEDPRVTFVPVLDRYVMAYTAFGPDGPRIAVALSQDGYRWERLGLVRFAAGLHQGDDKDGVFFPEPVISPAGVRSLALYHRPMLRLSTLDGRGAIPTLLDLPPHERECDAHRVRPARTGAARRPRLLDVRESALVLAPDAPWCRIKTGAGTPPVRIAEGWFSIFHGVDAREIGDGKYAMQYSAGFVVHDAERPHIVRYRSQTPVMVPEGADETHGIVEQRRVPDRDRATLGERAYEFYLRHGRRAHRPRAPAARAAVRRRGGTRRIVQRAMVRYYVDRDGDRRRVRQRRVRAPARVARLEAARATRRARRRAAHGNANAGFVATPRAVFIGQGAVGAQRAARLLRAAVVEGRAVAR